MSSYWLNPISSSSKKCHELTFHCLGQKHAAALYAQAADFNKTARFYYMKAQDAYYLANAQVLESVCQSHVSWWIDVIAVNRLRTMTGVAPVASGITSTAGSRFLGFILNHEMLKVGISRSNTADARIFLWKSTWTLSLLVVILHRHPSATVFCAVLK